MAKKSAKRTTRFVITIDTDLLQRISLVAQNDNRSASNLVETQLMKLYPAPSATAVPAPQIENLGRYVQPDDDIL